MQGVQCATKNCKIGLVSHNWPKTKGLSNYGYDCPYSSKDEYNENVRQVCSFIPWKKGK